MEISHLTVSLCAVIFNFSGWIVALIFLAQYNRTKSELNNYIQLFNHAQERIERLNQYLIQVIKSKASTDEPPNN